MTLDLSRWAVVAHKDDTGFGRLAEDLRAVLGLGRHLVIPSERLWDKPLTGTGEDLLEPSQSPDRLRSLLKDLQGFIFFERHSWHPQILPIARELGVRSVCLPTWEWFRGTDRQWKLCDLFICSSRYSLSVIRRYGFRNSIFLPIILDIGRFSARSISGPARLFIHNAGLVDANDRKGTGDTIRAFRLVKRQDIELSIRMQKPADLPDLDHRMKLEIGNLDDPGALWRTGDVAIQPSKMEGIGLMVLEPVLSGMPVLTLDYPPMSEFVRQDEMRVRKRWFNRKAFPTAWVKHAHLRLPDINDLARKIEWCTEHDMSQFSVDNRRWAESVFDGARLKDGYSAVLQALLDNQLDEFLKATDRETGIGLIR